MNIQTWLIFIIAIAISGFAFYKYIKSRGACDDCNCSCPVKKEMK
ncbi:MAG TPA: FeoB-associated Cys-rich membrane protein [Lactococcus sp.]|nr:FeoB-associated Cys-rich membrane protein [Lactococcus plantarum]MDN6030180.1 FeoB-associated Cys-rich membrane protein [Lactococcus plantarum]MDN6071325.1 FeoB-associated Cys-rich membrane protein [Lactococcus plantarum]MDN6085536.1 FeoB-associated Cys-rich membrane protein [Lactococcus plantarum]HCN74848.1 FeoB-associated Cys-rich membrane protein [Lactococcus sp.]